LQVNNLANPTIGLMMTNPEALVQLEVAAQRAKQNGLPYFGALMPTEAYELLSALPGSQLIDVRTRAEWDYVGRVPQSTLIEWQHYPGMKLNPNFLPELEALIPDRTTPVIFMCRSGVRSHSAAAAAAAAGYTCAFNLLDGFEGNKDAVGQRSKVGGWRAVGLPWIQS
jgi:rhodanese-related sulfurtransferase